jgi:hypothetical protein
MSSKISAAMGAGIALLFVLAASAAPAHAMDVRIGHMSSGASAGDASAGGDAVFSRIVRKVLNDLEQQKRDQQRQSQDRPLHPE